MNAEDIFWTNSSVSTLPNEYSPLVRLPTLSCLLHFCERRRQTAVTSRLQQGITRLGSPISFSHGNPINVASRRRTPRHPAWLQPTSFSDQQHSVQDSWNPYTEASAKRYEIRICIAKERRPNLNSVRTKLQIGSISTRQRCPISTAMLKLQSLDVQPFR